MKILKKISYLLLFIFLITGGVLAYLYKSDIPVEILKKKYTYPDSRFKQVNGMKIHYRVKGVGDPLVLLHGSGSSLHTWEKWIDILSKDFKVIALDLPAYGLTGAHPSGDYSMETYGLVLDRFLNKLNVDSFYLAGNSFGGHVAWTYTLNHPDKVRKLALLNSSGYTGKKTDKSPLIFRLARNELTSLLLMKCMPRSLIEKSVKEAFVNQELVSEKMINRYFELALRTGNRQAFVDRLHQTKKDYTPRLKELDLPVLLVWGEQDKVISAAYAGSFKKDIKGAELILYENVGHLPMEEIPSQSATDLKAFLWYGNSTKTQLTSKGLLTPE